NLVREGVDELLVEFLGLAPGTQADFETWYALLETVRKPDHEVEIALVGKYIQLDDAYKSHYEALAHAGIFHHARVRVRKISADTLESADDELRGVDGVLVPGGFGERGFEGKVRAAGWARERGIPYLGVCYGMQAAVVEFARKELGLTHATTTEFGAEISEPVISLMEEQKCIRDLGGTMRLGAFACELAENSRTARAYGTTSIRERHRHRYEYNNDYRECLEAAGLASVGINPDLDLVEVVEVEDHPFFVGVQYHPEFKSRPLEPHPLFRELIGAALERRKARS
ncbi:MAG TPA: CTP synthase, partial [Planctomycetota bacterium]|nr:CTP synthase [Planctomycetota bacterium]